VFDAATEPVAALQPDPNRAVAHHIGQVIGLVQTLIAYGKNLADTLRQHAAEPHVLPCFAFVARTFSTGDIALILARITRGLLRAAALEARLRRRAARGRDLEVMPIRVPSQRKPHATKPATQPHEPATDPRPARLPTPQEIVARDRRRPVGAILVDICLDLGIVPGQMDRATWDELSLALALYGGNLATLLFPDDKRRSADPTEGSPSLSDSPSGSPNGSPTGNPSLGPIPTAGWLKIVFPAWPARSPQSPVPACTGPPERTRVRATSPLTTDD
jgi:hypothetical protein